MPSCTMQTRSSSAITPAEPIAGAELRQRVEVEPTSISSPVRITVEEPPGITAFSAWPAGDAAAEVVGVDQVAQRLMPGSIS